MLSLDDEKSNIFMCSIHRLKATLCPEKVHIPTKQQIPNLSPPPKKNKKKKKERKKRSGHSTSIYIDEFPQEKILSPQNIVMCAFFANCCEFLK